MRRDRIVVVLLSVLTVFPMYSQFYGTGQTPLNISWREIRSDHFNIVYPASIEKQAIEFTNLLEISYPHVSRSLGHKPDKISVLLNNQSVSSNGYVVWAPKRMEIVTTPPQNSYSQSWLQQLALHELRHVVQVDKLNKGLINAFSYPFGQIVSGGAAGFLPFWYLEGDAVVSETSLSNAGRGEQPEFKMGFRAITLDKKKRFPYRKAFFGSYKEYIPNYYELGYLMTSYARIAYNPMVWDTVLNYIPKKAYTFFPFHFGLKHFGTSKNQLYQDAFTYYENRWSDEEKELSYTRFKQINAADKKNDFVEYKSPQVIDENTYVVLKTSLNEIPTLYKINRNGSEQKLYAPGFISDFTLSYANGKLAWAEKLPDVLWSKKNFSVIKIFDLKTNKIHSLKEQTRYFSPDLSSDAQKIVTIENTENHQNHLCILDVQTGGVIDKYRIPNNATAQTPRWNHDDTKIVMTVLGDQGKSIIVFNLESETWRRVLPPTFKVVTKPIFFGENHVIFNAGFTDIGNIYGVNPSTNELYQITSSRYGAYDADVIEKSREIVYSDYTANGHNLVLSSIDFKRDFDRSEKKSNKRTYEILREQETWSLNEQKTERENYESKKYNRFLNVFNFHSWTPFYVDLDELSITDPAIYPGIQLYSQNLLNTVITTLGYSYHENDHFFNTTFTLQGIRPIFQFSLDYGGDLSAIGPSNVELPEINQKYLTQNYRLYLPVNLTKDKYFTNITPSIELDYRRDVYYDFQANRYRKGLNFVNAGFLFYRLREMAFRDLYPKFGQVFQAQFFTSPVDRRNFGSMMRLYGTLYFPGVFTNHSLILRGNYQTRETKNYFLPYSFTFPRGFEAMRTTKMAMLSTDYTFPLLYPDLDLFRMLYFKRLKATAFYDLLHINPIIRHNNQWMETGNTYYNSFGLQVTTDFHLANILFPLDAGYRIGFQPERDQFFGEFVFNLDINRF